MIFKESFLLLAQAYSQYLMAIIYPEKNIAHSLVTPGRAILLSWPSVIMGSMLNLLALTVMLKTYSSYFQVHLNFFSPLMLPSLAQYAQSPSELSFNLVPTLLLFFVWWQLLGMLCYPFWAALSYLAWRVLLHFYQRLSGPLERDPTFASDAASSYLASNFSRAVPFGLFHTAVGLYVLARAMAKRLNYSWWAILCVLSTPTILFLGFGVTMVLFTIMTIQWFWL